MVAAMASPIAALYEPLAALLDYPTQETGKWLEQTLAGLRRWLPEALPLARAWQGYVEATPLGSLQEQYTHTFDLNPVCSLAVGYYLFGEDYQRGMFLVRMRECLESVGLEGERELPDHLPVVLRWLARTPEEELRREMVTECLLPVLRQMEQALAPLAGACESLSEASEGDNPYRSLLQVVRLVLERDLQERGPTVAAGSDVAAGGAR